MKTNFKIATCLLLFLFANTEMGCSKFSKMLARGGTEFKIQVETDKEDKKAVVQLAIKIVNSKMNAVGLSGDATEDPDNPNGFIVKLYGSQDDLERSKTFLFTTHQLELRKLVSPPNPSPAQTFPTAAAAQQVVTGEQNILPYPERDGAPERFVIVDKTVIVSGEDIRDAQAVSRNKGDYQISFSLKPDAATKFGDWTGKNINNYLAVVLDNKVQSIAFIKSQIFDSGEITGKFSKELAEDIALSLKSGYLPATMKVVEEKQFDK